MHYDVSHRADDLAVSGKDVVCDSGGDVTCDSGGVLLSTSTAEGKTCNVDSFSLMAAIKS